MPAPGAGRPATPLPRWPTSSRTQAELRVACASRTVIPVRKVTLRLATRRDL